MQARSRLPAKEVQGISEGYGIDSQSPANVNGILSLGILGPATRLLHRTRTGISPIDRAPLRR